MELHCEFTPATASTCDCCGGPLHSVSRCLTDERGPYGVYYAAFGDKHSDRTVAVVISLGAWGDGSTPQDRIAFALRLRPSPDRYEMMIVDSALSPWHEDELLGQKLTREASLKHPRIGEVFGLVDQIATQDPEVTTYLQSL